MKKLFLDCGANNGNSVRKFRKEFDPKFEYEIVSFEPNIDFKEFFSDFKKHTLINKAIWIENTTINFYVDKNKRSLGSTLIKEKSSGKLDKSSPRLVECIDFPEYVKSLTNYDKIIIKMDIEGAEYKVLEKMLDENVFNEKNNTLFIEWHYSKVKIPKSFHDNTIKKLKENNVEVVYWDAIKYT